MNLSSKPNKTNFHPQCKRCHQLGCGVFAMSTWSPCLLHLLSITPSLFEGIMSPFTVAFNVLLPQTRIPVIDFPTYCGLLGSRAKRGYSSKSITGVCLVIDRVASFYATPPLCGCRGQGKLGPPHPLATVISQFHCFLLGKSAPTTTRYRQKVPITAMTTPSTHFEE